MPQANSSSTLSFGEEQVVNSVAELFKSAADPEIQTITAAQDLTGVPEIRLSPDRTLRGPRCRRPVLQFAKGAHGLCLTSGNLVADLELVLPHERLAIWNDDACRTSHLSPRHRDPWCNWTISREGRSTKSPWDGAEYQTRRICAADSSAWRTSFSRTGCASFRATPFD